MAWLVASRASSLWPPKGARFFPTGLIWKTLVHGIPEVNGKTAPESGETLHEPATENERRQRPTLSGRDSEIAPAIVISVQDRKSG
jgi:hypothetical protein